MVSFSEDTVTQGLHAALGAIFVILPVAWGWKHAKLIGSFVGLVYAGVKEFSFDIYFEDSYTSGDWVGGLRDFLFYVIGIIAANLLLLI
jgi:hypothetical protein